MERLRNNLIIKLFITGLILLLFGCEKEDSGGSTTNPVPDVPTTNRPLLITDNVSQITSNSAVSGGTVTERGLSVTERGLVWNTSGTPSISDNDGMATEEDGAGSFSLTLSGLRPFTTYFIRSYAKTNDDTEYGNQIDFITLPGTITYNGYVYPTIDIDNKEWFAKNLRTTTFNDGTSIPEILLSSEWQSATEPAYSWYENNQSAYAMHYGALYNAYAVNTGNLCPTGWRVPTIDDFLDLVEFAGGESVAARRLKAQFGWEGHPGTDDYGFAGVAGGSHSSGFWGLGISAYWWSQTETESENRAFYISVVNLVYSNPNPRYMGFSVRCVRDIN